MAGIFDRRDSDGDIVIFRKDGSGTSVGSIGVTGTELGTGAGDANLLFMPDDNAIAPASTSSGGASNGALDLGRSGRRFKDLYLSGGVYLGGTVAANKLSNYENNNLPNYIDYLQLDIDPAMNTFKALNKTFISA